MSYDDLKPVLLGVDVIYLGEEHYTPSHIQAALTIMDTLVASEKKAALALEMFSWDGQSALGRYGRDEITSQEQFLQESNWEKNWGGNYQDYEPLISFAKTHHLSVFGLNPPRSLVRLVASKGLEEARLNPTMKQWGMDHEISLQDSEYRRVIFRQIQSCHPDLPEKAYQRFYEASIFRDEGMAKVIKDYLQQRSADQGPLVSYTGGGHIQYKIPIPNRVKKGLESAVKDVSIYLIALDSAREDEIVESINNGIADYVWLTALSPRGPQPRCG